MWALLVATIGVDPPAALPEPTPSAPVTVTTLPQLPLPDAAPPPPCAGPPACAPFEDCNGPLLIGDPLLDGACGPLPGCIFTVESGVFKPHLMGRLTAPVNVANLFTDTVFLPNAPLDWTSEIRVEAGYRFPQAFGELLVGFRSLVAEGDGAIVGFDPFSVGALRSRLDLNVLDVDYGQNECSLGPCWGMKWRVGARLASIFTSSQAVGLVLEQSSSSHFLGGGPDAGLELWRHLGGTGVSLYSRLKTAALWGTSTQNYGEAMATTTGPVGGVYRLNRAVGVPTVDFSAGVSWQPPRLHAMRVAVGYEIEGWWYLANNDFGGRADLGIQGVFLRGEWGY
jgi:hypothetical protein